MSGRRCLWGCLLIAAGCGAPPPRPPGEAEAVAHRFFTALVGQDWSAAYAALDGPSRARVSAERFTQSAKQYRRGLGFEPGAAHVRSCEEHGEEAVAHVVLTGQGAGRQHFHKDAVTLRRGAAGWGVVLPPRFGAARPRGG